MSERMEEDYRCLSSPAISEYGYFHVYPEDLSVGHNTFPVLER